MAENTNPTGANPQPEQTPAVTIPFNFEEGVTPATNTEATASAEHKEGEQEKKENIPAKESTETKETKPEDDTEIVDPSVWLKEQFGWDNEETGKKEIQGLREQVKQLELPNEDSKKAFAAIREGKWDDLYNILSKQKNLNQYTSIEVNKDTAADIIKYGMSQKYKDLSSDEINYKFNKQFGIPPKPVQNDSDTEEEYNQKLSDWENKVTDIQRDMVIEAKLLRPDLEKQKAELVFPDIPVQQPQQTQLTPEEVEQNRKYVENYMTSVEQSAKDFKGFNVNMEIKDEAVQIPIEYGLSDEENKAVSETMKSFAENQFDANAIFAQRWLNKNGTVNAVQVRKDLSLLFNGEKMIQKFANEGGSKRFDHYLETKKNPDMKGAGGQPNVPGQNGQKAEAEKMQEFFWNI